MTDLQLEAHLDLVITPPDGAAPVVGRVRGEGATLVLTTAEPGRFVAELRAAGATDVRGIAQAAELLADRSVTIRVDGPRGTVLQMGAEAGSPLGRLLTGSSAVGIGAVRAAAPLAPGAVRDLLRLPAGRVGVAAVLLLLIGAGRRLRWPRRS